MYSNGFLGIYIKKWLGIMICMVNFNDDNTKHRPSKQIYPAAS